VALNDETYVSRAANLVIAMRGSGAIAGVIGGKETAIGPETPVDRARKRCLPRCQRAQNIAQLKLRDRRLDAL